MQNLTIQRTNGNVPRTLAGEDHISGLLFYHNTLPSGFSTTDRIKAVSSIETAEELGITADAQDWGIRVLHYQLTEIFNLNPAISLYLGIFAPASSASTFVEIKKNHMNPRIKRPPYPHITLAAPFVHPKHYTSAKIKIREALKSIKQFEINFAKFQLFQKL